MAHDFLERPDPGIEHIELDGEGVTFESSSTAVRDRVLNGEIVLARGGFRAATLHEFRRAVFDWGQRTPDQQAGIDEMGGNFHRVDPSDPEYWHEFPHMFHFYTFYDALDGSPDDGIETTVLPVYRRLHTLYAALLDVDRPLENTDSGPQFHPQVIQYPRGGGYLSMHRHAFEPMRIGMILLASEPGTHFENGGTRFIDGETIHDIQAAQTLGDIALFRYDLVHSVYPVDPEQSVEWDSENGRWTVLLPYH